jgi:hypothetical protein
MVASIDGDVRSFLMHRAELNLNLPSTSAQGLGRVKTSLSSRLSAVPHRSSHNGATLAFVDVCDGI